MHSRDKFYSFVYLFIAILLICKTLYPAINSLLSSNWGDFTDYLYNYAGGFIRRGLTGELLIFFHNAFSIPPLIASYAISVIGYIIVAWFIISHFKKEGYGLNVLIMGFTLGGLLIFGIDDMRRDYIELSLLIGIVYSFKRLSAKSWIISANLIAVIAILLHEPAFFFIVPICILLTNTKVHNIFKASALWIPTIAIFGLCCIKHGDSSVYSRIIAAAQSLAPEAFIDGNAPFLLEFMNVDIKDAFKLHLGMNYTDSFTSAKIPTGLITLFYFIYIPYITIAMLKAFSSTVIGNQRISSLLSLIVFQFLCLTPMFTVLSCDIVRVSLYWIMSSTIVWLILDDREIASMFPHRYNDGIQHFVSKTLAPRIIHNKALLTFFALFIGVTFCVRQPTPIIRSSPVGAIVYEIHPWQKFELHTSETRQQKETQNLSGLQYSHFIHGRKTVKLLTNCNNVDLASYPPVVPSKTMD